MPPLHSLCLSPTPSSLPNSNSSSSNIITINTQQLSAKPSNISPAARTIRHHPDLPLPLPDLPTHMKEKIISLEMMGVDSGRALAHNPALRDASPSSIHDVISFLLSRGVHHKDLPRILGMCPRILTSSVRRDLLPVFTFLSDDLHVPDSRLRKPVNKCPRLLVSSVRDQLRPALIYLQRLGFTNTLALAYQDPILLVSSVEHTLIPKLDYLTGLGLSRGEAAGMAVRCPALFTFSVDNNFEPKYGYLVEEMGRGLEEVKEFPQFFAFSLEKRIVPRHREMEAAGVALPLPAMLKSTDEEFKELIQEAKEERERELCED